MKSKNHDLSLRLYVSGKKGFSVLKTIANTDRSAIADVVYAGDPGVTDDFSHEIKRLCNHHNIAAFARKEARAGNHAFSFCAGWKWIISDHKARTLVIHDSVLPKYRGFNPLVTALINGDKEIGATLFEASYDNVPDSGPILISKKLSIDYPLKIEKAIDLIAETYTSITKEFLSGNIVKTLGNAEKQNEALASYSLWRDGEDYWIDWEGDSKTLERFVDAVGYPYEGAKTRFQGQEVTISEVSQSGDLRISNRDSGKVIRIENGNPVVVCGSGLLTIREARNLETGKSILPLLSLRSRFGFGTTTGSQL